MSGEGSPGVLGPMTVDDVEVVPFDSFREKGTQFAEARTRWLSRRRTLMTATDAAKVLGISRFGTRIDVYADKLGDVEERDQNAAPLVWGRRMEPVILRAYHETVAPLAFGDPHAMTVRDDQPLIGATLDARRADDGTPVDAKNARSLTVEWGEDGTDQIPLYYATQLIVQMFVTKTERAHLPVLFGGNDFRVFTLHRNPDIETTVIGKLLAFWNDHVVPKIPPSIDGTEEYAAYLKRQLRQETETILRATGDLDDLGLMLQTARENRKQAETDEREIENRIKAAIGTNKGIQGKAWRAVWSTVKDSQGTNFEGVATDYRVALALVHGKLDDGEIRTYIEETLAETPGRHLTTKKGYRRFLPTFSE